MSISKLFDSMKGVNEHGEPNSFSMFVLDKVKNVGKNKLSNDMIENIKTITLHNVIVENIKKEEHFTYVNLIFPPSENENLEDIYKILAREKSFFPCKDDVEYIYPVALFVCSYKYPDIQLKGTLPIKWEEYKPLKYKSSRGLSLVFENDLFRILPDDITKIINEN